MEEGLTMLGVCCSPGVNLNHQCVVAGHHDLLSDAGATDLPKGAWTGHAAAAFLPQLLCSHPRHGH